MKKDMKKDLDWILREYPHQVDLFISKCKRNSIKNDIKLVKRIFGK